MLPYVVLYCVVYTLFLCNGIRRGDLFINASAVCVFLFSSLRFMVGWDYANYYDAIVYDVDNNVVSRGEWLTIALIEISRNLKSPYIYFFVNALLLFLPLWWLLIRKSSNKWLSLIVFLSFPLFFLNSLSVVRMFSALGIVLIAVDFLFRKKLFIYFALVLVAASLHKSALLSLVFIVFLFFRPSRTLWSVLLIVSFFGGHVFAGILQGVTDWYNPIYSTYLERASIQEGTKAIYVFLAFVFVLFFVDYNNIKTDKRLSLYYNIYLFGVCVYLAFLDFGTAGHRLSLYGTIYLVILLPSFIRTFDGWGVKLGVHAGLHLFFIFLFFYTIQIGSETYIPYKTIFEDGL
jgi:hypothetical protein